MKTHTNIPNLLTFARLLMVPIVVGLFYLDRPTSNWAAASIFILACITDYLDGYFARTLSQISDLGKFLDPIADKVLIAATILMLVGFDRIGHLSLIPAVIILCREVLVSGLREFLADTKVPLPVTQLAKWKTGIQMTALSLLIIDYIPQWPILPIDFLGTLGLWIAGFLTVLTGYDYLKAGLQHID